MKEKITLENIENFRIPFSEHPLKWKFEEKENQGLSPEFEDQIIPLNSKAANFIWKFERTQKIFDSKFINPNHFKIREEFTTGDKSNNEVKKWLYKRGIPFQNRAFWVTQPECGFVLTWKMVIKFSDELFFGSDELIWDKSLNWVLIFDHNDVFYFGKDRIYNSEIQGDEITNTQKIIEEAILKSKQQEPKIKSGKNIYKR